MNWQSSGDSWRARLKLEIEKLSSNSAREVSLDRLYDRTSPPNESELIRELSNLIEDGVLVSFYVLLSPRNKSEVKRYRRLSDIPETELDTSTGNSFHPDPFRDLELVYASAQTGR